MSEKNVYYRFGEIYTEVLDFLLWIKLVLVHLKGYKKSIITGTDSFLLKISWIFTKNAKSLFKPRRSSNMGYLQCQAVFHLVSLGYPVLNPKITLNNPGLETMNSTIMLSHPGKFEILQLLHRLNLLKLTHISDD